MIIHNLSYKIRFKKQLKVKLCKNRANVHIKHQHLCASLHSQGTFTAVEYFPCIKMPLVS